MSPDETRDLFALLDATAELYDKPPLSAAVRAMWARDLAHLPLPTIRGAFDAHRRSPAGRFMPKPADLLAAIAAAIESRDGHPGADEAWSIAIGARHEDATVVWTEQISAAFFAAAMPLLDEGDKIAARRAFIDRYEVEVATARRDGIRAKWSATLGTDPEQRRTAVESAVQAGRIPLEHARSLLPLPAPTPEAVKLLGTAQAAVAGSDVAQRALAQLKSMVRR